MDARCEDDLIEIAADGNYLMLCRERQMLFLDGAAAGKLRLSDVRSFGIDEQALVVHGRDGSVHVQPFPSAAARFLEDAAERLEAALVSSG